jgi:hypothetical protein
VSLGLSHSEVPPTRFMGMRLTEAVLGTSLPIMVGQDRASWKLGWYGNFQSKQAQTSSGGGSGLGKSGSPSYVYSASVLGFICMGPCNSLLGVWGGTSSGGKFAVDTVTETYNIPSSGSSTYQVSQNAIYAADAGVSFAQPYSYTQSDYQSQAPSTLSGTTNVSLQRTTTNPPGVNQYYVNPATGQYTFNTANASGETTAGSGVSFVENVNSSGVSLVTMTVQGLTPQQGQVVTFGTMTGCPWLSGESVTLLSAAPVSSASGMTGGEYTVVFVDPTGHAQYPQYNSLGQQVPVACTGTITPSSSATGTGVATITYTVYSFLTVDEELAIAAPVVAVEYQTQFTADLGVSYFPSDVALTPVFSTPTVAGTYWANGGNYEFAPGDYGQEVEITYSWTQQNTDANAPSTLSLTFFAGGLGQAPWQYLSTNFPEYALGYSEVCYAASENMYLGYTNMLPELSFEIAGQYQWGHGDAGSIPDANPADAIYGLLTNPSYKYNFPAASIDNSLLVGNSSLRNQCAANNFFISSLLDDQSALMSVIGDWCEAAQCWVVWDEGRLKFVTLSDSSAVANGCTYTPNTQPVISLDDNDIVIEGKKDPITITQTPWQSRWNRVAARWSSRENDYNDDVLQIEDEASINTTPGFLIAEDPQDWQFIKTQAAAQYAANLRLQRYSAIYTTFKFVLKSNLAFLSPGDIIVLTDGLLNTQGYMFANQPVRITKMTDNPDSKGIEIEAENFPWSVSASLLFNQQSSIPSNTNDGPQEQPGDTTMIAVEIPDGAGLYEGDIIKIAVNGAETSWGGCQIFVSDDGISYSFYQQVDTPARIGTLVDALPYSAADPDLADSLVVNMTQSETMLSSVSATTWNNYGTLSAIISPGANVSPKETATSGVNIGTTSSQLYAFQGPFAVTYAEDIGESVGPFKAGVGANGTGVTGNQVWTSPGNVGSAFPTYAKSGTVPASGSAYKTTVPLKATGFGFNLPTAFVPGGVEVNFNQGYTTAGIPAISVGPVTVHTYSNNNQTRGWPGGLYTASSPAQGTAPARNGFPYSTAGVNSLVFNQVVPNYPINGFTAETNVGIGGGYKLNPMVAVNQTSSGIYSESVTLAGTTTNEQSGNFDGFVLDCQATLTVTTPGYYTFYVNYANVSSFAVYIGGGATFSSTSYNGGNGGNAFPSAGPITSYPLAIVSTNMNATAHPYVVSSYVYFPSAGTYGIECVYNQYLSTQFSYDNNGYFQVTFLAGQQTQAVGEQGPGIGTQFLPTPVNTTDGVWSVQLLKAGTATGSVKTVDATYNETLGVTTLSLGADNDLWGVSGGLLYSDVNNASFGVQFKFTDSTGTTNDTVALCGVTMEVFGYTPAWSSPANIEGDTAYATTTVELTASGTQPTAYSHDLLGTYAGGKGFSLPSTGIGALTGFEVAFVGSASAGSPKINAQLYVNGNTAGAVREVTVSGGAAPYVLGADTDLWGLTTPTAAQVNADDFGVVLYAQAVGTSVSELLSVNKVEITAYWNGGNNGSSWTTPGNVGSSTAYAYSMLAPTPTTNTLWLLAGGFQFQGQLPFGMSVDGFEVEVDSYGTSGGTLIAQLVYQGLLYGVPKQVAVGTSVETFQFGNSKDEWGIPGYGLNIDMVLDPSFGVALQMQAANGSTVYLRNVRAAVYGGGGTFCELVAYQNADLTAENVYTCTRLYRGLYGSYPISSPAGSQFVRLDNNCLTYKVPPAYRGQNLYFKAASFNAYGNQLQSLANVAAVTVPILTGSEAPGAIDALNGQLTTGTANQSVFRIDPVIDAVQGSQGVNQVPVGYALAQLKLGNTTPQWTQLITAGDGTGALSQQSIVGDAPVVTANYLANPWDYAVVDTSVGAAPVYISLPPANGTVRGTVKVAETTITVGKKNVSYVPIYVVPDPTTPDTIGFSSSSGAPYQIPGQVGYEVVGAVVFQLPGSVAYEVAGSVAYEVAGSVAYQVPGATASGSLIAGEVVTQYGSPSAAAVFLAVDSSGNMYVDDVTGTPDSQLYIPGATAFQVLGSVASGTFAVGEQVSQATSLATAVFLGLDSGGNLMVNSIVGTPDSGDTWTGQGSGATFAPTAVPSNATFAAGETITQQTTSATATLGSVDPSSGVLYVSSVAGSPASTDVWVGGTSGAFYVPTAAPTYTPWVGSLSGAAFAPTGAPSGASFTLGETVTQDNTSATAVLLAFDGSGNGYVDGISGSPDSTDIWVGNTSGAFFVPTAAPTSAAFQVGETVTQAASGATSTFLALSGGNIYVSAVTGTADSSDIWTGATSGAFYVPTADPTSASFTPTETITQTTSSATAALKALDGRGQAYVNGVSGTPNAASLWTGSSSGAFYVPTAVPTSASFSAGETAQQDITGATAPYLTTVSGDIYVGAVSGVADSSDLWVGLTSGAYFLPTAVPTSAAFDSSDTLTQASTSASAPWVATLANNVVLIGAITGSPDSSHIYTGSSSGAFYVPTAVPVSANMTSIYYQNSTIVMTSDGVSNWSLS